MGRPERMLYFGGMGELKRIENAFMAFNMSDTEESACFLETCTSE